MSFSRGSSSIPEPPSPVLAGGFFTTEPPEKPEYELTVWKERIRVHSIVWGGTCKHEAVEILKVKIRSKDRWNYREMIRSNKKVLHTHEEAWTFIFFSPKYLFGCARFIAACGIFSSGTQALSCSMRDLVFWPEIEPKHPALRVQSPSHWTTREVPKRSYVMGYSESL